MRLLQVIGVLAFAVFQSVAPVKKASIHSENETNGTCSQIINDNTGTVNISCPGLTTEQMKQLLAILNRVEKDHIDPAVVLKKLNEISSQMRQVTHVTQALAQRTLSEESKALLTQWAMRLHGVEGVSVRDQDGDHEANHLAEEILSEIKPVAIVDFVGHNINIGGNPKDYLNVLVKGPRQRAINVDQLCDAIRKSNIVVQEELISNASPQTTPIEIVVYSKP